MDYSDNSTPVPGWTMRINEVSSGHFVLSLTDRNNRRVEINCADHEVETEAQECVAWAREIDEKDRAKRHLTSNG